jgi:oligoribonuclease
MQNKNSTHLIWIDLEMTGLDPVNDRIIEIATIVTDTDLNIIAEGPNLAIKQSDDLLNNMDKWNTTHHNNSGLVQKVQDSSNNEVSAEKETLSFLNQWVSAGASPMCGNSICQDRRFLANYMPDLERHFHYRNLDVSTLKILAQRWAPEISSKHQKISQHRALDDIKDSIEELKFYRNNWLKNNR